MAASAMRVTVPSPYPSPAPMWCGFPNQSATDAPSGRVNTYAIQNATTALSRKRDQATAGTTMAKSQAPSLSTVRDDATYTGILIALGVLAITVGLIRTESTGELRTLSATPEPVVVPVAQSPPRRPAHSAYSAPTAVRAGATRAAMSESRLGAW
jgi:hypothetical protein